MTRSSLPSPHKTTLTTPRLRLVPLSLRDEAALQRSFPRWPIVRYMTAEGIPWPYPADGAHDFIRFMLPEMDAGRRYCWGIHLKDRTRHWLIGTLELRINDPKDHIGFWLAQAHWGNGYMREAVAAVCKFAFEKQGMKRLHIANAIQNEGSRNVQIACGGRFVGRHAVQLMEGPGYNEVWEITPQSFAARPKKRSKKSV